MQHEFAAVVERDDDWFIAYAPEIPGATEAVPRHREIPNVLARKIRRGLSAPELGR